MPYFFNPHSIEVELNPNIFPESEIEWMQVARKSMQEITIGQNANLSTDNIRLAYDVNKFHIPEKDIDNYQQKSFDGSFRGCLFDFLYNHEDKFGLIEEYYLEHEEEMNGIGGRTEYIVGRGNNDYAIEPQYYANQLRRTFHVPFPEINVKVLVKMKGMENPVVLSRNYLPEIKEYGNGAEFAASTKKTRPYQSKMRGHTDLYDYQMKRISDIIDRYELYGNWDGYNYIPLAGSPVTWESCGYENLFNGNTHEGGWEPFNDDSNKVNGVWYVEFKSKRPITPSKYYMTTSFNASYYPYHNPKSWKVYAKANASDSWTTIATVTNDNRLSGDEQRFEYPLSVTGRQWQYFRLEVSENHGGTNMQFAEFEFDQK